MSFGKISLLSKLFWLHSSTAGWHCSNSDAYRSNTSIALAISTEFAILLKLSVKNCIFQNFFGYILALLDGTAAIVIPIGALLI
jgi:hypothetical protein